jgi:hypothetical protein
MEQPKLVLSTATPSSNSSECGEPCGTPKQPTVTYLDLSQRSPIVQPRIRPREEQDEPQRKVSKGEDSDTTLPIMKDLFEEMDEESRETKEDIEILTSLDRSLESLKLSGFSPREVEEYARNVVYQIVPSEKHEYQCSGNGTSPEIIALDLNSRKRD